MSDLELGGKFQPVTWQANDEFKHAAARGSLPISSKIRVLVQFHTDREVSMYLMYGGVPFLECHRQTVVKDVILGFDTPAVKLQDMLTAGDDSGELIRP